MNLALDMKTKTQTPKQAVIEWIDYILDRKRWNGTELARKSGLAPSTLLRLLNDPEHPFLPSATTLRKIADGSGIPITKKVLDAIGVSDDEETPDMGESRRMGGRAVSRAPMVEFRHVSALPAALQAAASGVRRETLVPAPPQIAEDETAFAFQVPDDSMSPWLRAGFLAFATKKRDPNPGDLVMVTGKDGKTKVRVMSGIDEGGLRLCKPMSTDEETLAFDDIQDIAIVAITVRSV